MQGPLALSFFFSFFFSLFLSLSLYIYIYLSLSLSLPLSLYLYLSISLSLSVSPSLFPSLFFCARALSLFLFFVSLSLSLYISAISFSLSFPLRRLPLFFSLSHLQSLAPLSQGGRDHLDRYHPGCEAQEVTHEYMKFLTTLGGRGGATVRAVVDWYCLRHSSESLPWKFRSFFSRSFSFCVFLFFVHPAAKGGEAKGDRQKSNQKRQKR